MGLKVEYIEGQTPLEEDEKQGLLIPSIMTRADLDEFEQQNIQQAVEWTISRKLRQDEILTEEFVKELHHKMFNDVWEWAGHFRTSNKNLGVDKYEIAVRLRQLNDDTKYWAANRTYPVDEIAVRFKHMIVSIHCFPNGNGRHSRLIGDVIVSHIFGKPIFSWGRANIQHEGETRKRYLDCLHQADAGDIQPLVDFARA